MKLLKSRITWRFLCLFLSDALVDGMTANSASSRLCLRAVVVTCCAVVREVLSSAASSVVLTVPVRWIKTHRAATRNSTHTLTQTKTWSGKQKIQVLPRRRSSSKPLFAICSSFLTDSIAFVCITFYWCQESGGCLCCCVLLRVSTSQSNEHSSHRWEVKKTHFTTETIHARYRTELNCIALSVLVVFILFYFSDWAMPSARGQIEELSEGGKIECKTPSLRMDKDSEASSRWARLLRKKALSWRDDSLSFSSLWYI